MNKENKKSAFVENYEFLEKARRLLITGSDMSKLIQLIERRTESYKLLYEREQLNAHAEVLRPIKDYINLLNSEINDILHIRIEK